MDKKVELNRKLVHLSSLLYPVLYIFIDKKYILGLLSAVFILSVVWEVLRLKSKNNFIQKINNIFHRKKEEKRLSGSFFFMLSSIIVIVFFNKYLAMLSISTLVVSDTVASFVGINYGKHKFWGKSVEGSVAFFISGSIIYLVFSHYLQIQLNTVYIYTTIFIVALLEASSNKLKIDDNLLITIGYCLVYTAIAEVLI